MRVVIAGGGTGGHLYPGIAVARELLCRLPDARVSFAGTARGLEARVVPREGFELDVIRSTGLKGQSRLGLVRGLLLVPFSLLDAWRLLTRRRPHVVVGVGGYSSGPVVLAAAIRRVPTIVLEANAVPGLANRLLAPWVRAAAVTYEQTRSYFGAKGFVSGNPVRPEFLTAAAAPARQSSRRVLLLGGSQGAHALNVAMAADAAALFRRCADVTLVHQTGDRDLTAVSEAYARAGIAARAEAFLDPVVRDLADADLVICRAGATTLAELAAIGRPAILVPFAAATDDHQRRNALALERAGAAVVLPESGLTDGRLAALAAELLDDPVRRDRMAAAMRGFARPDAAARIVDQVIQLAGPPARQAA